MAGHLLTIISAESQITAFVATRIARSTLWRARRGWRLWDVSASAGDRPCGGLMFCPGRLDRCSLGSCADLRESYAFSNPAAARRNCRNKVPAEPYKSGLTMPVVSEYKYTDG